MAGAASALLPDAIRAQLELVLASDDFVNGPKLGRFLDYVVRQTLAGQSAHIKQYTIGVEGMGYGTKFDPNTSPTVRMLARRLRRALDQYYTNGGAADPIRISIPKGSYVPVFLPNPGGSQLAESAAKSDPVKNEPHFRLREYPTVAVLLLELLEGQPDVGYLASGLTQEIIIALNRFPDISVIGPLDAEIMRQKRLEPRDIGHEYGARFVLDGTVRIRGQSLRASAKLTDTYDGHHVWAQSFQYNLEEPSLDKMEHELVGRIAGEIADNFGIIPRTITRELLSNDSACPSAYAAVLRFHHFIRTCTEEAMAQAFTALENAVQQDPNNDLALALLADLKASPYIMGFADDRSGLEQSGMLARRALSLNRNSQQAHFAMAQIHYLNFQQEQCLAEIERTLEANLNNTNYLAISALFLTGLGQRERGQEIIRSAMRLNPHHPGWYHLIPYLHHYYQDEFEAALVDAREFNTPEYFWDPLIRTAVLGQLGHKAEAKNASRELLALVPDFGSRGRNLMKRLLYRDENVDMLAEGLGKAGVQL